MKNLLFLFLLFNFSRLKAQDGEAYTVTYTYVPSYDSRKMKLVFNDSLSYCYIDLKGSTPKRKDKNIFGAVNIHHSTFFFKNKNLMYSMMIKPHPYMFIVESPLHKWMDNSDTKVIAGYPCKSALSINKSGDSVLVYYTENIPFSAAPLFGYTDIKGVVLEVYDQERSLHMIATNITKGPFQIIFPADVEIVSQKERNRRILESRSGNIESFETIR